MHQHPVILTYCHNYGTHILWHYAPLSCAWKCTDTVILSCIIIDNKHLWQNYRDSMKHAIIYLMVWFQCSDIVSMTSEILIITNILLLHKHTRCCVCDLQGIPSSFHIRKGNSQQDPAHITNSMSVLGKKSIKPQTLQEYSTSLGLSMH